MSVDPTDEDAMEQLRHEHVENGGKGLKLAPIYQGLHPLDPKYLSMYAYCQRHNLPILFHMAATFSSGVPIDYARPSYADEIACRYPDLRLVIAHLAHPWEAEALTVVRRNRNLFADVSALYCRPWQFYNSIRLAVEYGCAHKLLFGSDFPATTTGDSIRGVMNVNEIIKTSGLPSIPEETLQKIIHSDALSLLGIEEGTR
jgi:predicted TIM-barrel fold metal-dependent hydrolase